MKIQQQVKTIIRAHALHRIYRYTGNCQLCSTPWWVGLWKSSVQILFEEECFQIGLEGGETWGITQGFGEGIPGHRSYVWESTLSILVDFDAWNSHETSVCRTQRAGRLIDWEKIREVSRSRRISATIAQGGNLVLNPTFNGIFSQICNGLIQSLPILICSLQCAHQVISTRLHSGSMDIHIGWYSSIRIQLRWH